jgi:Na+-transporting methylmalonyl-CoA/oxaloacetate decarboxylase gamma subunit
MILQASEAISKNAEMAEKDPYGFIITIVSVTVVFASLIILYFAYKLVGIIVNRTDAKGSTDSESRVDDETAAAISMALEQHLASSIHDNESYIITIRRK